MLAPAVPELYEEDGVSAVDIRTDLLQSHRELGPPDLVHVVKQPSKSSSKQIGVYHHVTGVDASSSASLAAYVNTLLYNPSDKSHKVTSGLYCCYNAFSRLDMRVQVTIPGSVESYCIDDRGDKRMADESLWLETYLCSVLRAYSYADDGSGDAIKKIVGCRRFNPITSTEAEHRFMDAAERLFVNGWQLGSDPDVQVPNLVSNHLTTGLLKYINTTGRYASGINLFQKLRARDEEISSLLAQVYISADEEVKAVRLLHDAVAKLPMDYSLLDVQARFCHSKGRNDLALELAKRSVVSAPSEFGTWCRLAEIYIALEQWDLALLTLNSCPMFTYQDKDAPRTPQPERIHLPVMPESICDDLDDRATPEESEMVHPSLRKLVAANFKGTFSKAYMLLTEITKKIGWDQLLRIRSQVFVMEEEYRHERQGSRPGRAVSSVNQNGQNEHNHSESPNGQNGEKSLTVETEYQNGADDDASTTTLNGGDSPSLSKPSHAVAAEVVHAGSNKDADSEQTNYTSFRHKRLCERWLDNLFMVLYEDLRIYTIWRTETTQSRAQQMQFRKSADEWDILGDLAHRLHYEKDAVEAWQQSLSIRFSPKAMRGVMQAWEREGDVRNVIGAVIRLVCWQYRWYSEFSPYLLFVIRRLIEEEGAVKVRSMIDATTLPKPVQNLTHQYAQLCAAFRSNGSDT